MLIKSVRFHYQSSLDETDMSLFWLRNDKRILTRKSYLYFTLENLKDYNDFTFS